MKDLRLKIGIREIRFKIKEIRFLSLIFYLLILISYLLSPTPSAQAQQATPTVSFPRQYLSVTPIISELKIVPGKATSFDLKVKNLANAPLGIHAEVGNLVEPDSIDIGDNTQPLLKWTRLSDTDFIIDAQSERVIKVTINPPNDIKESGYYEVIYLTPFVGGQNQKEKPVVLSRIGALVFATYGELNYKNLKEKVRINTFGPISFFQKKPELEMELQVENNYFTHFTAKPFVTVSQILGGVQKIEVEEKKILPGKVRVWDIAGDVKSWGIYKANLALSIGAGEQIYVDRWFVFLPWNVLLVSIAILLIILLVLLRRKAFKKALRILFGKSE